MKVEVNKTPNRVHLIEIHFNDCVQLFTLAAAKELRGKLDSAIDYAQNIVDLRKCPECHGTKKTLGTPYDKPEPCERCKGESKMNLGCSDGNCLFRKNSGQVTNGGCKCVRREAIHTSHGWSIPVDSVKIMIELAIRVAVEKQKETGEIDTTPKTYTCPDCGRTMEANSFGCGPRWYHDCKGGSK
jgi:hypothetical protein